jgi:hypothetical protein
MVQIRRNQDGTRNSAILDQLNEISSAELVISQGRDVRVGIQPKFLYQSISPNYYELMEY